ncbi:lysis system i-spanin subunit Rz [Serratia liquefaciens]|nr:lysis system i-spanin subunit Rz [Serratia liquefaciens]
MYAFSIAIMTGVSRYYYLDAVAWRERADKATESSRQQESALKLSLRKQREVAELDKYYMEKLDEAMRENTTLRARLSDGTHRMLVSGGSPSSRHSCSAASRLGHAPAIELSADIGQHILSVRERIINDHQKLIYLQDYIRRVCLGVTEKGKQDENQ